ncbi:MAG: hypothetical protein IMY72_07070 [Bacteroidetes bacterium]|nr:hypothetical protein [Bacteroidota bacterium]
MKKLFLNKKIIFEFLSITFAVFLGLMLNTWKESHHNSMLADKSIKNIRNEIIKNKVKLSEMLSSHKVYLITIDSLINEIKNPIKVTNREMNLEFKMMNSTSWKTAKITQAVAYMDIDLVTDVAAVYGFQNYYENIIKIYSQERMTSIPETNNKISLEKLELFVSSIIKIEKNLADYYDNILNSVLLDKK